MEEIKNGAEKFKIKLEYIYMGVFKKLQEKKETGQYITADEQRFIELSKEAETLKWVQENL